jgi:hypothetical protein
MPCILEVRHDCGEVGCWRVSARQDMVGPAVLLARIQQLAMVALSNAYVPYGISDTRHPVHGLIFGIP